MENLCPNKYHFQPLFAAIYIQRKLQHLGTLLYHYLIVLVSNTAHSQHRLSDLLSVLDLPPHTTTNAVGMAPKKNGKTPEVAVPNIRLPRAPEREKEEDMFVLVDSKLPLTGHSPLVSSHDCYPPPKDDDKVGTKDKDGFETISLHGKSK
ncbi:hypothetical protein O1611_g4252 [Lasiodiplodia mahajangana]|uniref:Uncharacterized protein n=1 Tax=Lasiodiplodia mahajangana TaxID=1108764 RepID=A0ACC2JPI1_9PEZI|nr:hypothetical protein O1611_g4252 [Lasiodiplodia mahajangana]